MSGRSAVRFRDLGVVEVESDGVPRGPGGAVLRRLLARLLVDAGRRVEPDALTDAAWGDGKVRSPSTLDSHLWRLRRFLEPGRARGDGPGVLVADAGGYRLAVDGDRVDSRRFARLAAEADDLVGTDPTRAVARGLQARELWRGRPFTPCSDESWALAAVARMEELRWQLDDTVVAALLASGNTDRALVELEPVLAGAPLRERPWEHYVLAAARCGRIDDALACYRRFERLFRDELGIDPSERMRTLHADVLSGDVAPSGRVEVSAPVTAPREVHLPRTRTRPIGRDRELGVVLDRLATAGPVTLVGGAGCGKTTVAVAAARRGASGFPDGVWFVDLTSALDDRDVGAAVASTLGLPAPVGAVGPVETVAAYVADRRMLLVLDNCEHVLDGAAELVEELTGTAPDLRVLATSREPLDVDGETVLALRPLDPAPAVEMFADRLARARGRAPDPHDETQLAVAVCAALDGVPLAIELAAARGRVFGLAEILEQVRADPSALSRVGRGRGSRRTARAAVDRSVRLVSRDERELHRAMSTVPGPMTAGLAAALIGRPVPEAGDLLAHLAHRSLVVADGPLRPGGRSRFGQLAIVRGHGAHDLEDTAAERIADRRDRFVVDTVVARPRMGTPADRAFQHAVDDDLPAVRAALHRTLIDRPSWEGPALAAGLGMYWYYRGMLLEGGRWIELAVRHRELARPVDDAVLRSSGVALHALAGDTAAARGQLDALCRVADTLCGADLLVVGDEFAGLSSPVLHTGDREMLTVLADRARDVADRTGDPTSELMARAARLKALPRDGAARLADAVSVYSAARELGNHYVCWMVGGDAVRACLDTGDVDEALLWAARGVEDHVALGAGESPALMELQGNLHARRGDDRSAVRLLACAHTQCRRAGMRWPTRPETPGALAAALRRLGRATYDRIWRDGAELRLADLAPGRVPRQRTAPAIEAAGAC